MVSRHMAPVLAVIVLCAACSAQQQSGAKIPLVGEWPAAGALRRVSEYQAALVTDPSSVAVRVELAKAYAARGQWHDAIDQAKLAVESDTGSADGWIVLALAYANVAEFGHSMSAARRGLQSDPKRADAHFALGWAYLNLDQWSQARASLENALVLRPDYFDALRGLGVSAAHLQDFPDALRAWDKAVALRPDEQELRRTTDELRAALAKNLQPLRDRVALRPEDWSSYASLGDRAAYLGLFGEALAAYYEAARLGVSQTDPIRSARLFYNIGVVYRQMEDYDQALLMLDRAILLDPKSAAAHYNVGLVQAELGDDDAAVAAFERAVVHERHSVTPFIALADAYLRLGQVNAALGQYEIVKEVDPGKAGELLQRIKDAQSGT